MRDPLAPLLPGIASGDRAALAALYRAMEKPLFRFLLSRVNDPAEAADLLQDVFMEVWRGAGRFEGRAKVQTWIFGIARRKAIDAHRRRGRLAPEEEAPEEADDSPDALACLAAGQEASHVRHCLGELREAHRSVVALAFYEDMTQAEIAEVEGVPEGIVKSRLHHAKRLLLRCLEGRMGRRVA